MADVPAMLQWFRIGEGDVAANRAGHLGPKQVSARRGTFVICLLVSLVFAGCMGVAEWAQHNRVGHGVGDLIAPVVFAVVICGFLMWIGLNSRSWLRKGLVIHHEQGLVRGVGRFQITVGDQPLRIAAPTSITYGYSGPPLTKYLDEAEVYDVWWAKDLVISMYPAAPAS